MQKTELAAAIAEFCTRDGVYPTSVAELFLTRSSTTRIPRTSLDRAVLCVVAQGVKSVLLNGERCVYDPSRYLLLSLDLPLVGQIEKASGAEPMLCLSLLLDFEEIGALMESVELPPPSPNARHTGLAFGQMNEELLDAVTRLVKLLRRPAGEITVLAPLVRREIHYRLLLADESGTLRRMAGLHGKTQRIAAGLKWVRQHAHRPIRMEELARELGMSGSAMHSWFRAATGMSPLQFQKHIRLQNARRLMLAERVDAAQASRRVGYESPTQFSREYRRLFGAPPKTDVERLRAGIAF